MRAGEQWIISFTLFLESRYDVVIESLDRHVIGGQVPNFQFAYNIGGFLVVCVLFFMICSCKQNAVLSENM